MNPAGRSDWSTDAVYEYVLHAMAKNKPRPNEPCFCASGRKYKKCCGAPGAAVSAVGFPHNQADRTSAFAKLNAFIDDQCPDEDDEAYDEFWDAYLERSHELPRDLQQLSDATYDAWCWFDTPMFDGERVVDHVLRTTDLRPGERSFLCAMRDSSMRLYDIADVMPGISITLRDLIDGTSVTVNERAGSRSLPRHECLAARVIPRGTTGGPEMETGVLHIPKGLRDQLKEAVLKEHREWTRANPRADANAFFKTLPPLIHEAWLTSIFNPPIPRLTNTDGDELVLTRLLFDVVDGHVLMGALGAAEADGITPDDEGRWTWTGKNPSNKEVTLGTITYAGGTLTVETNSVKRGDRSRELLERLAGEAIRHRATSHEDMRRRVQDSIRDRALGVERDEPEAETGIDPEIADAIVGDHYAKHYRAWIDEPVPALDGLTPRDAARRPAMRARVVELIRGIENQYETALRDGSTAYDPSWMWTELGLEDTVQSPDAPPMAHERVAERVPGCAAAVREAAERIRARPSFDDRSTTVSDVDVLHDIGLQRFLRTERASANDSEREGSIAAPYVELMLNFEIHRRKVFWVDGALTYMLENTDVDIQGDELRAPFPSFALVFNDRHALSLGERLLSGTDEEPLRGHILRVITAYVTERDTASGRVLAITFAFDALGADLPAVRRFTVPADGTRSVREYLDSLAPNPIVEPAVRDMNPTRALLRLTINAILYSTSSGVVPEARARPTSPQRAGTASTGYESDSVFYLPGKIDIRHVRQLQALDRLPSGRPLLARFMVRGHWRRAAENWTDKRRRWIEPYWKGPDMAAVIEKAYRLKE